MSTPESSAGPLLGPAFDRALALASDLHRDQTRKGTDIPYLSHLLSVAALVIESGGDEEEAIAALLHDALEDCPDRISAEVLEKDFGERVRRLVEACTDTPPGLSGGPKPEWRTRKGAYVRRIASGEIPWRAPTDTFWRSSSGWSASWRGGWRRGAEPLEPIAPARGSSFTVPRLAPSG